MDVTPEAGSARACDKPVMPSQLIFKPAATTSASYVIERPAEVVTDDAVGENVATFSLICAMCGGNNEASGRLNSSLERSPAPTRVLGTMSGRVLQARK